MGHSGPGMAYSKPGLCHLRRRRCRTRLHVGQTRPGMAHPSRRTIRKWAGIGHSWPEMGHSRPGMTHLKPRPPRSRARPGSPKSGRDHPRPRLPPARMSRALSDGRREHEPQCGPSSTANRRLSVSTNASRSPSDARRYDAGRLRPPGRRNGIGVLRHTVSVAFRHLPSCSVLVPPPLIPPDPKDSAEEHERRRHHQPADPEHRVHTVVHRLRKRWRFLR